MTARLPVRIDPERIPTHVGCVMDGNGRWAEARGLPRTEGHLAQGFDGHLAVNLGGGGAPVADIITNGLQGPSGVDQALDARVAERVTS